ncbi:MAG TPA: RnfABCDGE type electron transport complex subunit D [Candidatus Limadaptatus stercoravium]|nr:RnfABCDGE type electron transport complex subunit D [Candidatus Limadaptatus stercoravium]
MKNLRVSSSPHIVSSANTQRIMLDVIIALCPAVIAMVLLYGFYPLFLTVLSVATAVFCEWAFNLVTRRTQSVRDLSAVVTGIILALNLPPVVPFYVPIVGAAFAIVIVKMLFGGIGRNFANPAITARIFLMLAWTGVMTQFVSPIDLSDGANLFAYFNQGVSISLPDAITTATPLQNVKDAISSGANPAEGLSALDMFLGRIGGSAGEVSALAVLIGGVYLAVRRVIDVKIPVLYIGSTALFTAIFFADSGYAGEYVWTYLLGGGLMFGAFFMATDYATSPKTPVAVVIYGVGLGLLTVIIRKFGTMNEGVSFAILLMNIVTPLLEKIKRKPFGTPVKSLRDIAVGVKAKFSRKNTADAAEGGESIG